MRSTTARAGVRAAETQTSGADGTALPAAAGNSGRSESAALATRLRGERDEIAKRAEPCERLTFELPDALTRQVELVPDRLERPRLALEPEAQLEDPPLAFRQRVERLAHTLAAQRLLGLLEWIRGFAVGEQVAEITLVVGADGLVQRDRRLRGAERLVDVLHRQTGRLRELFLRRLAAELDLEPARGARQLLLALADVD